jgi:phosphoglycolate phosphatase-like HAD superfamily hydrolase
MKLLLWDIDGTLVDVRGLGAAAMNLAFQRAYKTESSFPPRDMAGKTDLQILKEFLDRNGIGYKDLQAERRKIFPVYYRELKASLRKGADPFVFPGVREILASKRNNGEIVHALLTGNFSPVAKLKLERFKLWGHFAFGAFGEVSAVRQDLVPHALAVFRRRFKWEIEPADVYVIGDTPNDIGITKPYGIRSVAVATGHFTMEQLAACGPDFLIPDLSHFPREILG